MRQDVDDDADDDGVEKKWKFANENRVVNKFEISILKKE